MTFNNAQGLLIDAHNIIWKEVAGLHKSSWDEEAHGSKRDLVNKLAMISDAVDLARLLLDEAQLFLSREASGLDFLESLKSEKITELTKRLSKT